MIAQYFENNLTSCAYYSKRAQQSIIPESRSHAVLISTHNYKKAILLFSILIYSFTVKSVRDEIDQSSMHSNSRLGCPSVSVDL